MPNTNNEAFNIETARADMLFNIGASAMNITGFQYYGQSLDRLLRNYDEKLEEQAPVPPVSTWVNPYANARMSYKQEAIVMHETAHDREVKMNRIADAVMTLANVWNYYSTYGDVPQEYKHIPLEHAKQHAWFLREVRKYPIHSAIKEAFKVASPVDMHALVLEWPHASVSDPSRVAYTRSEQHGESDRQTVTSVGKYLRQHFKSLTDSQLRDIVVKCGAHRFEMWDKLTDIIRSVQKGPISCMKWSYDAYDEEQGWPDHPYNVYKPEYGWRSAVRLDGQGNVVGRCLVNVADTPPRFVRSYRRNEDGYSPSDEALEAWLREQGYEKESSWEGCKIAYIRDKRGVVAPYIDGGVQEATLCGDHLVIEEDGEYGCSNTEGHASHNSCCCACCDNDYARNSMHYVGHDEDTLVCVSCLGDRYRYVLGRSGRHYYVHEDYAVYCDYTGAYYDEAYLGDNAIVQLENGEYCPLDQAVETSSGCFYHCDDENIVYTYEETYELYDDCVELHDRQWTLQENAWECEMSNEWYHEDDEDQQVKLSDLANKVEYTVHEDEVEDAFGIDLEDVTDACEAMLAATESN